MPFAALLAGTAGILIVVLVLGDAFETMLVPRRIGRRIRLTRYFYLFSWRACRGLARRVGKPSRRENVLGLYGPLSLILLLVLWAAGLIVAFALLQWAGQAAAGRLPARPGDLLYMSGETFFTLGFGDVVPDTAWGRLLSVFEAGMGFGFLGTVIGYLPTLYSAFSQREIEIALLDGRAGSPPTAAELLGRAAPGRGPRVHDVLLRDWERWSAQVLETHISYPLLAYYRSQHSNQSWLGALTVILDSSSLLLAGIDGVDAGQAGLTFAMARHALVDVTQIFVPRPDAALPDRLPPEELGRVREHLARAGLTVPAGPEFELRLRELRRLYEPYAQSLAAHLLLELPPWVHHQAPHDNWRGGPWDKLLGAHPDMVLRGDDHF
jgi:hypothetical protein